MTGREHMDEPLYRLEQEDRRTTTLAQAFRPCPEFVESRCQAA